MAALHRRYILGEISAAEYDAALNELSAPPRPTPSRAVCLEPHATAQPPDRSDHLAYAKWLRLGRAAAQCPTCTGIAA